MSMMNSEDESCTDNELPGAWTAVPDDSLEYNVLEKFVHQESGQEIRVRHQKRPTQMHTPETSEDDTGYVSEVTDGYTAPISPQLSDREIARTCARSFMASHPKGDYYVPDPSQTIHMDSAVDW